MTATVFSMSDYRMVFVLPDRLGTVVFLASRGCRKPRIAHERTFADPDAADAFAEELSRHFGCNIIGGNAGREDIAR